MEEIKNVEWLVGHRFKLLTRRDFDWVITFDGNAHLVVECLWRLIENGCIRLTSSDDGHEFGLPAPVEATQEVNSRLENSTVKSVELREGRLDLILHFDSGHGIEVLPDSSGYEAWNLGGPNLSVIACGGGRLTVFSGDSSIASEPPAL
jgi:uncharacterized protein DUF6188